MKDLLHSCHEHSLRRGAIIQIFYHGLDEATQAILDAEGIFLYKTPNETYQLLENCVLLKLDWSKDMKAKPICKTVTFVERSNDSKLMENMEAYTNKIDSQFKDIKGEIKDMQDGCNSCRGSHPSSECDVKNMGGPKHEEANYGYRGYRGGGYQGNYYGRPFLYTADAIIRVKYKELNLRVGDDIITFLIDKAIRHSHSNDDTCLCIDDIDEVTEKELDALLDDSKPYSTTSKKFNDIISRP
nr:reverse transcriptase domain-containing protein [Tanacetum cinerariifolium]